MYGFIPPNMNFPLSKYPILYKSHGKEYNDLQCCLNRSTTLNGFTIIHNNISSIISKNIIDCFGTHMVIYIV